MLAYFKNNHYLCIRNKTNNNTKIKTIMEKIIYILIELTVDNTVFKKRFNSYSDAVDEWQLQEKKNLGSKFFLHFESIFC